MSTSHHAAARGRKSAFKDEYAVVNGVRLHYVTAGEGPLILFLHGFPEFWYEWTNQLAEFSADHLAAAPDMRGYNLSEKPEAVDEYRIANLIEDVRALANHLSPGKKFTLVAHDWGGAIAWQFAVAHPGMLHKLVVINAPHLAIFNRLLTSDPDQQKASQYMVLFRSPEAEKTLSHNNYAMLVDSVLADGLKTGAFTEADKAEYIKAWSQPGALTGGLNYYRAAHVGPGSPMNIPASSQTVSVPTLVIWGDKDAALLPQNLTGLDQFVPDLTIHRIPDGSHWVVHEKPAEVNRAIRSFI